MKNRDLTNTLSGCRFYRRQEKNSDDQDALAKGSKEVGSEETQRSKKRIFKRYCLLLAILVAGSVLLVIIPLWLVYPAYGKAFLLSLPPMLVTALSWMVGAWWAWDKSKQVFMVATMGGIPVRLAIVLGWAWLVLSVPGVPVKVFVPALMVHWVVFTVPEIAMLVEFGNKQAGTSQVEPRDSNET